MQSIRLLQKQKVCHIYVEKSQYNNNNTCNKFD